MFGKSKETIYIIKKNKIKTSENKLKAHEEVCKNKRFLWNCNTIRKG